MLSYERGQIKRSIKRKLMHSVNKSELVLLKFTPEESEKMLRWEHSKEFEYKGEMYDVVETRIEDGFIYYWCWEDKEETVLNRELERLVLDHSGFNKKNIKQTKNLSNYLASLFFSNCSEKDFNQPEEVNNFRSLYIDNYINYFNGPEPPPPKSF